MEELNQAQLWLLADLIALGLILALTAVELIKSQLKGRRHRKAVGHRMQEQIRLAVTNQERRQSLQRLDPLPIVEPMMYSHD
jgi:hypothetical protein